MKPEGRVLCEVDDIIRLYKSKQVLALQHVGEELSEKMQEMMNDVKSRWNDDCGTAMEMGETIVLMSMCGVIRDYLLERNTGEDPKKHDENCSLVDII